MKQNETKKEIKNWLKLKDKPFPKKEIQMTKNNMKSDTQRLYSSGKCNLKPPRDRTSCPTEKAKNKNSTNTK